MAADESHDDRTQSFVALTAGTAVSLYRIIEMTGIRWASRMYTVGD